MRLTAVPMKGIVTNGSIAGTSPVATYRVFPFRAVLMMPKSHRRKWLAVLLGTCTAAAATAQEGIPFRERIRAASAITLPQDEESTLPEIEVRPPTNQATDPEDAADVAPDPQPMEGLPGGGDALAPPVVDGGDASFDADTFDPAPFNNPAAATSSLSNSPVGELFSTPLGTGGPFGANTGVLRGGLSAFDAPAGLSIRSRSEIERRQAPDMLHALQNEVGVLMQSTAAGQASPFVRGLVGQQVLILIDGIRLNNSITRRGPNQYFNTIDPGMVDHIEVLRGQGSVLWGSDAIGGAINVVTRGADLHRGLFHGGYGQRQFVQYYNTSNNSSYSRMNVEGWVGNAGVFGGGSFLNVRNLDTGFEGFGRQPGTNYQQYAGDLKLNYLLGERSLLTVAMQHFEQELLPRSDRFPGYPQDRNNSNTPGGARFFDPQQRDLFYVRYQALDPFGGLFDAVTATASYHRQREIQTRGIPTSRFQETDVDTTGLQVVATKDAGAYGRLTTGVDWYYDDIDSAFGGAASGPIVPDDAWYRRAGFFANWDVPLTSRLLATAGVRFESIETDGTPIIDNTPQRVAAQYEDWVSQVGLTYRVTDQMNVFGSISEGFRAPNLDDLMANNPNVLQQGQSVPSLGLVPENSLSYEVGVKTRFDRLRTQTSVFWLDIQDNIVSITAAPNTFASANQDSFVHGVEFSGDYLLSEHWALYGNFWSIRGRNEVTDAPLSRIPPLQGILGLRYVDDGRASYFDMYTWMSDRQDRLDPVRDLTDERIPIGGTPGFATLNMRMGRAFGDRHQHRLSLSLENLTDKDYLVHGSGVLGTGATARIGYDWIF